MNIFKPSTWFKAKAHPVQINPANHLLRHVGRIVNLFDAQIRDPSRKDVRDEIALRAISISDYGHAAPTNAKEARELLAKLKR